MPELNEVYIVAGARTAIGTFGGSLKDVPATTLATTAVKEAVSRSGVAAEAVEHCLLGNVIHSEPRDMYMARVAAVEAGLPVTSRAITLNRLCGSGFQTIVSAAQMIQLGDVKVAVAGGVENMSRGGYMTNGARWGVKMGDTGLVDMMVGALTDPFGNGHMGITAENLADRFKIGREEQDAFAAESHRRASEASKGGLFKDQIVPVEIAARKKTIVVDTDEHIRHEVSPADMAKLRPAFKKDGSVTAGNASGVNDAACAVVLADGATVKDQGLKPMARLVSYGHSGCEPEIMGYGPVAAVKQAMDRAGLSVADMDVIESNEAFAVQAMTIIRECGFDPANTNPNGGAVALGHPIGATGAIICVKAMYELQRTGGKYGLITMCIGGGQGIAGIIEAC